MVGGKESRSPDDVLDHRGEPVGNLLKPVAPGAAVFAELPALYDNKWVCEVELVRPHGNFIRSFRSKARDVKELLLARARVKVVKEAISSF